MTHILDCTGVHRCTGTVSFMDRLGVHQRTPCTGLQLAEDAQYCLPHSHAALVHIAVRITDDHDLGAQTKSIQDDLAPSGERARIRLINAMSDFPSPLGLWQNRRTALVRRVEYLEEAPYRNLDAGNYPLEVRRTGTKEAVVPVVPYGLARNATYTMFAFGTLREGDLDARLVLDATEGVATLRR